MSETLNLVKDKCLDLINVGFAVTADEEAIWFCHTPSRDFYFHTNELGETLTEDGKVLFRNTDTIVAGEQANIILAYVLDWRKERMSNINK